MNPALLPRALTAGLVAIVMALSPGRAQTALDKVSFGTNWVAEAEHGGFFQAVADGTYQATGSTSPSCRAARTTTTACC
jgi:NitT/TauT family transport system substrate-binding protein